MNEKSLVKSTALLDAEACPCQSGNTYAHCCGPYHQHLSFPQTAEQLMRSRYCAYVLNQVDYLVATTLPAQQQNLDPLAIRAWAESVEWLGLEIIMQKVRSKFHKNVEFKAYFAQNGVKEVHHENSLFVKIQEKWYFLDHTAPLPTSKKACICGSGKKFKHCCGAFL